jgi:hypothetical protein
MQNDAPEYAQTVLRVSFKYTFNYYCYTVILFLFFKTKIFPRQFILRNLFNERRIFLVSLIVKTNFQVFIL